MESLQSAEGSTGKRIADEGTPAALLRLFSEDLEFRLRVALWDSSRDRIWKSVDREAASV